MDYKNAQFLLDFLAAIPESLIEDDRVLEATEVLEKKLDVDFNDEIDEALSFPALDELETRLGNLAAFIRNSNYQKITGAFSDTLSRIDDYLPCYWLIGDEDGYHVPPMLQDLLEGV